MTMTRIGLDALDRIDPLASLRERFALPDGVIYMDGNSLGARPKAVAARVADVIEREWGDGLIRSWNDAAWMEMPGRVGAKIGRLIGAEPDSVMVADSTSVNVFKLLGVALALRPDRKVIVSERGNFPTDLYIAEGLAALLARGHELRLVEPDAIEHAIDDRTAVVMLTHVNYHTGAMHDMAAITARAHAMGALALWDLAHSAGAVPVDLAGCAADLAVGCGYKFLNGGPGAPAFLYVAPRHQAAAIYPLTGWLGHAAPFAFERSFRPASGIHRAIVGTPPVISLAALEVGVDLALEAPIEAVRAKSLRQTSVFSGLVEQECASFGLHQITPVDPVRRGSQISLAHPHAYEIMQALIARGLIGDFRAPDVLRFGVTPLYLRFVDLWDGVQILQAVMQSGEWQDPRFAVRRRVT
jgi:kynureninase